MNKAIAHILEIGCSGIVGVALTIGYQHFFAPSQSFTFINKGEEVIVTETEYTELVEQNEKLNKQLSDLNKQLEDKQDQIDQKNSIDEVNKIIQDAINLGNNSDFVQALSILNSVENKTSEIEVLISDYTQKYESYISEQVNTLKSDQQLDEASELLKEALTIVPNSQVLKDKQEEIKNSYPQNMLDVASAYQSGGNKYKEYISSKSGATDSFNMGGVKYTNGMTFNADYNVFDDVSWAIYNLDGKYNNLEFIVCHVDGTYNGDETCLQIFYDGNLKEEIPLSPDMSPHQVSLDVSGVVQLKMQVPASGGDNPEYGVGNPTIK